MAYFLKSEYPEIWVRRLGPVTARQAMQHYDLKTEEAAVRWLDNLVRDGRLRRVTVDGAVRWDLRRR